MEGRGRRGKGGGDVSLWGGKEEETKEAQTKKWERDETETRAKEEEAREKEAARSMCGSMKADAAAAPTAGEEPKLVGVDIHIDIYYISISLGSLSLSPYL